MENNFQVVLINPSNGIIPAIYYAPTEHLGLAYLAAVLREKEFPVKIIDAYALNLSYQETLAAALEVKPRFIGITAEYNTIDCAMELMADFRRYLPDVHLSLGGEHATYSSRELFVDSPNLNSIIRGEGELTIVEVMSRLINGQDLTGVAGVYFRDEKGQIITNRDREAIENLNILPFPARDTLEACLARGITPAIGILTSRGCHANCSFCNASKFFNLGGGKRWRSRDPKNVVDEIQDLLDRYGNNALYNIIYFNDENFIGPDNGIQRAIDIAREIIDRKLKISFELFCRADSFDGHEEAVKILSQAGLVSALVGLESGYQKQLNKFGKGTTVNQNLKTIELFKKYNIITSSSGFLMFNPYSTFEELEENAKFLLSIRMSTLYNMSLKVLGYPGIGMVNKLRQEGLLNQDFGHRNVSGYKFKDFRVEVLAQALNIDNPVVRKEDAAHRYLDLMLTQINRKMPLFEMRGEELANISRLQMEVDYQRFKANLVSYNFFIKALLLASNQWDHEIFDDMKKSYFNQIEEALEEMNDTFTIYLEALSDKLC